MDAEEAIAKFLAKHIDVIAVELNTATIIINAKIDKESSSYPHFK